MTGKYEISISWSDEDDAFIAEVPDLPGCNAHGPTYADAAREVEVAMSLWLDMADEFGWTIPEPKGRGTDGASAEATRKREIRIRWSDEDEAFIAEAPQLRYCTAHGDTYEEALKEIQVAIAGWVDAASEFGVPIPEPITRQRALKYEIVIWWSDEDDAFIVDVPQLEGCTAHGPTHADAAREVQVAMSLWLDVSEEFDLEIPEPRGERIEWSYIWLPGEGQAESGASRKREIVIYWSDKAKAYFAEVLDFPDCAADGRSYDEALAKAQAIMDARVAGGEMNGREEIPNPKARPRFA